MVRGTCFICLQYKKRRIQPVYLISLQPDAQCSCDGIVHAECLERWYEKSDKCPICRQEHYYDEVVSDAEDTVVALRTSKVRQILIYFCTLREETKRMIFIFSLLSLLMGVILLSKPVVFIAKDDYIL